MTDNEIRITGILAITKNFPDQIASAEPQGRLKGLYRKLDTEVIRLLGYCPNFTGDDENKLNDKLTNWVRLTKWGEKSKHPVTVAVFLIGIISDNVKNCGKLLTILQEIFDYFDRANKAYTACLPGGYFASQKFNQAFA